MPAQLTRKAFNFNLWLLPFSRWDCQTLVARDRCHRQQDNINFLAPSVTQPKSLHQRKPQAPGVSQDCGKTHILMMANWHFSDKDHATNILGKKIQMHFNCMLLHIGKKITKLLYFLGGFGFTTNQQYLDVCLEHMYAHAATYIYMYSIIRSIHQSVPN